MIVYCSTCNGELVRNNSQIKASKTGNFFCNRECRSNWDSVKFENQKVEKKCQHCQESFYEIAGRVDKRVYCSRQCVADAKTEDANLHIKCDYCDINFVRQKGQMKDNNFCSIDCRSKWNASNHNRKELICVICNKEYEVTGNRENTSKTCSKECHYDHIRVISTEGHMKEQLRQNGIKSTLNSKTSGTKPERMVEEYLVNNNIDYESQKLMHGKFIVDFFLPSKNIVLEVNGDYWHANPEIYGEGLLPVKDFQVKQIKKDKSRKAYLTKCGYSFKVAWEKDIYNDINSLLKSIIS